MSNLTGTEIKDTYKDLLHMGNANTGVTSSLVSIKDGEGTESALSISSTEVSVDGKLGIGTTSPSVKLHVDDNALNSGNVGTAMRVECSGSTSSTVTALNVQDSLYVQANGNVGIGTTLPNADLSVNGLVESSGQIRATGWFTGNTDDHGPACEMGISGGEAYVMGYDRAVGGYVALNIGSSNTERIRFPASGESGISIDGATTFKDTINVSGELGVAPTGKGVHMGVRSVSGERAVLQLNGSAGGYIDFSTSGVDWDGRILYDHADDYMRFDTKKIERMRINSDGNVGIGTTSPEGKLEISHSGSWNDPSIHLKGTTPTIKFNDINTSEDDWYIHINSNNFYILRDKTASGGDDPIDASDNNWDVPYPLQLEGDTDTGYLFGNEIATTNMFSFDASTQTLTINM